MKKIIKLFSITIFTLVIGFLIITCSNGGNDGEKADIARYKKIGESVAAKKYVDDVYNRQNFATQFYQNCYKAGLPCRARSGTSGGKGWSRGSHAWNSVLINGKWVDWEPQSNKVHIGHIQTPGTASAQLQMFNYTTRDLTRLLYELVGRNVPSNIIDLGLISDGLYDTGRFSTYFEGLCIDDNHTSACLISGLNSFRLQLPNNGDGGSYAIVQGQIPIMIAWIYKMNDKHYAVEHLQKYDSVPGRSVFYNEVDIDSSEPVEFFLIDLSECFP